MMDTGSVTQVQSPRNLAADSFIARKNRAENPPFRPRKTRPPHD
jgi:hypothetical protein